MRGKGFFCFSFPMLYSYEPKASRGSEWILRNWNPTFFLCVFLLRCEGGLSCIWAQSSRPSFLLLFSWRSWPALVGSQLISDLLQIWLHEECVGRSWTQHARSWNDVLACSGEKAPLPFFTGPCMCRWPLEREGRGGRIWPWRAVRYGAAVSVRHVSGQRLDRCHGGRLVAPPCMVRRDIRRGQEC
jgi:hypothetical protein